MMTSKSARKLGWIGMSVAAAVLALGVYILGEAFREPGAVIGSEGQLIWLALLYVLFVACIAVSALSIAQLLKK